MSLSEDLENCFRLTLDNSLIQVCSQEELLKELEIINQANERLDRFLKGELTDDDFLSFIEQYTPIDSYIANVESNLTSWVGDEWK